jgi:hypothetical protein
MDTLSRTFQDIPDAQELDTIIKKVFQDFDGSEDESSQKDNKLDAEQIKSSPHDSLLGLFSKYLLKYKNIKGSIVTLKYLTYI